MAKTINPILSFGRAHRTESLSAHHGLATLRTAMMAYRARRRFRLDLERMSKDNPHLVDDIGLTHWQAEAEIAKRFWER